MRLQRERAATPMRTRSAVVALAGLIAALAVVAAGIGLLWQGDGDGPTSFTTVRGEAVQLYGRGLYQYDTLFIGGGNKGTDAVTLVLGVPLLVLTTVLYRRGSLRGGLGLLGTLGYFLYVYASYALGVAYNPLFLVYVALFSASLFAFVLCFTSFDTRALANPISPRLPWRGAGVFMIASGAVTLVIWLGPLLGALVEGDPPARLGSYTTTVTDVLDLGIITPTALLTGALLLRRAPLGILTAFSLLVLEALLAPLIAAQTVSQISGGISFTPGEVIGPMVGFASLGLAATWVTVTLLRAIHERSTAA